MRAASGEGRVTLSLVLFQATVRWACILPQYTYFAPRWTHKGQIPTIELISWWRSTGKFQFNFLALRIK